MHDNMHNPGENVLTNSTGRNGHIDSLTLLLYRLLLSQSWVHGHYLNRPNKNISVFPVTGLKILVRVGRHF